MIDNNVCTWFVFQEMANIILDYQKSIKELEKKSRECFFSMQLNNLTSDINIIAISQEKKKVSGVHNKSSIVI